MLCSVVIEPVSKEFQLAVRDVANLGFVSVNLQQELLLDKFCN